MVAADGCLWRASAAVANNRAMHQRWPGLARSRVQQVQDPREPTARCYPPATRYAAVEAGGIPEMRRSCRKGRYAPPVHMIKLTETRQITPYKWVHPNEER